MENAILNWIEFNWFDGSTELGNIHEDHIWDMMKEGYTQGELIEGDVRGWWKRKIN